jgi:hypothetical protein
LTVEPVTGRYYSEMAFKERPGFEWIPEFVKRHLVEL